MSKDKNKTKAQLILELKETREQLAAAAVEDRIKNSQSQDDIFKFLAENSATGTFVVQDTMLVYVNPCMAHMLGYKPEEMIGKLTLEDLVHPDDIQLAMKRMQKRLAGNIKERNIAYKAMKKDDSLLYVEVYGVLTEFEGKPAVMGTLIDVTERKSAELALQEAIQFQEKLISEVPVGISIYEAESGQCVAGNKSIADLVGATEEQVLTQNFYTIKSWKDSGLLETAKNALKKNEKKELEVNVKTTFGKDISFYCYFVPFVLNKKRYLLFTLNDFTEQRQMREQLIQAEKMQAVGQLAGGIAHDFNNQLAGIVGFADMLREELSNNPELAFYADNILLTTKRASDLTSQLLAFARKGKYLTVAVNIHSIIHEVVNIIRRTIDKRIVIKQHLDAQFPTILGDPTQIQNAIMNIALNSRDAMPKGGELIFATSIVMLKDEYCKTNPYEITPGEYVQLCITDGGIGMDEATKMKIFEPFFTTKGLGKGTGMGLASVFGTLKSHHGAINVYSEPGHGTTMKLYFPLHKSETLSEEEPMKKTKPYLGNAQIMLVDDEDVVIDSASRILKKSGYKVVVCRNGSEAIELFRENWQSIDLVILDMVMPVFSGRETYLALKEIDPHMLTLLSSGYSINGEAQEILDEGVNGFIQKPYRWSELSQKVGELLEKYRKNKK